MRLRLATAWDSAALLAVYAPYIDTPVTFEYVLPEAEEFARRIADITAVYPYIVAEEDGRLVGYAYAHRQKERAAYQWNAELSVYVDARCVSRGIGTRLYTALMELLRLQGVRTVYGIVTVPNERSERLHAACGFRRIGTCRHTGYKNGQWWDVGWFEKELAPYGPHPAAILPVGELPRERVREILESSGQESGSGAVSAE